MTGGGGSDTTTQSNEPWAAQQGPLKNIYSQATTLYNAGDLGALGEQSPYTTQAQQMTADRAAGGGYGLNDQAAGQLGSTIQGDYLSGSNPYLQDAIKYGQQPVIDSWNEQVAPGIASTMAMQGGAGALGSGAFASARNRGEDTLARNLSGAATQAAYQNYGDERTRQQQAIALAPSMEEAGYAGTDRLGQVGGMQDQRAQLEAEQRQRALQNYTSLITQTPAYATSTSTGPSQGGGWGTTAAQGAGAAAMIASLFAS
jgi:hypothetical protein